MQPEPPLVPVPVSATTLGLLAAFVVRVTAPEREPVVVGVKVTEMLQDALAAKVDPHVVVFAKSPVVTMLVMLSVAPPVFVSVSTCAALVLATTCGVNVSVVAESDTNGVPPEPPLVKFCDWIPPVVMPDTSVATA